jgi:hypothetical protein
VSSLRGRATKATPVATTVRALRVTVRHGTLEMNVMGHGNHDYIIMIAAGNQPKFHARFPNGLTKARIILRVRPGTRSRRH